MWIRKVIFILRYVLKPEVSFFWLSFTHISPMHLQFGVVQLCSESFFFSACVQATFPFGSESWSREEYPEFTA